MQVAAATALFAAHLRGRGVIEGCVAALSTGSAAKTNTAIALHAE